MTTRKELNGKRDAGNPLLVNRVVFAALAAFVAMVAAAAPALMPRPREMKAAGGSIARVAAKSPKVEKVDGLPPEGYELSVKPDGVTIRHSDDAGLFYAKVTLEQLLAGATNATLPCVEIKDTPAFRWRGVHLEETQRLFGKQEIKRVLDQMSRYKLNVFHWHFVDAWGCRVDIPACPELARRSPRQGSCEVENVTFYSAKDVREILDYAKRRHITIVPEFEFPGHFGSVTTAYPDFMCPVKRGRSKQVMCIGNPKAVRFAEKVCDGLCELFPSEVIHIGGDECSREPWKRCPRCQALIAREGLKGVEELQPWLTRHLAHYLAKKGRRVIGWDEIFTGGRTALPKSTMGMCWRLEGAGAGAANAGHEIVRSPTSHWYFDYAQGLEEDPFEYFGTRKGFKNTLEKAYSFDPLEGVDPEKRGNVVGGECCNWTMYTFTRHDLEWKMWPRTFAVAEILWTYPDPAKRDFAEFSARAAEHRRHLIRAHVNCAPLN